VLLPSSPSGVVSWAALPALNYSRVTGGPPPNMLLPGIPNSNVSAEKGKPRPGDTPLPTSWPVQGGWAIRCPVQFQGTRVLDIGFVPAMFEIKDAAEPQLGPNPDSQQAAGADNAGVGPAAGPRPLFQFVQMGFRGLPQGDMDAAAGGGSAASWQAAQAAAVPTGDVSAGSLGGSSWVSKLPAEAYTHLMWFISR
jgi:hypothetical protein